MRWIMILWFMKEKEIGNKIVDMEQYSNMPYKLYDLFGMVRKEKGERNKK